MIPVWLTEFPICSDDAAYSQFAILESAESTKLGAEITRKITNYKIISKVIAKHCSLDFAVLDHFVVRWRTWITLKIQDIQD